MRNNELRQKPEVTDVITIIVTLKWRWAEHFVGMETNELTDDDHQHVELIT